MMDSCCNTPAIQAALYFEWRRQYVASHQELPEWELVQLYNLEGQMKYEITLQRTRVEETVVTIEAEEGADLEELLFDDEGDLRPEIAKQIKEWEEDAETYEIYDYSMEE